MIMADLKSPQKAYAINSAGTGYGNELVVKTYSGTVSDSDGNTYYDGTVDFNKIAKSLASTVSWTESIFTGSPGNPDFSIKRNASGFSALASGIRFGGDGIFGLINSYASWWTSSYGFNSNLSAYSRGMRATKANIEREDKSNLRKGLSVRCLKN